MRLGVVLGGARGADPLASLIVQALTAEAFGLSLAMVETGPAVESPLVAAGAISARTNGLRLVAVENVGRHPIGLAEDAVVVDNLSNGRLVLVLAGADHAQLAESAHVVALALRGRPFRHQGVMWTIPARLDGNKHEEERIVVTPPAAQLRIPLWLAGDAAVEVGCERRLPPLLDQPTRDLASSAWERFDVACTSGDDYPSRPVMIDLAVDQEGRFDADALVALLLDHANLWDMDIALIRLRAPADDEARMGAIRRLGSHVRPRVLQDRLPNGLQAHWNEHLNRQIATMAGGGQL